PTPPPPPSLHDALPISHARAAAAVGDAKGLMQIQMTNVTTVIARTTQATLGVHVRSIHEDLAAVRVHDVADFADGWLKHAVRGGDRKSTRLNSSHEWIS